MPKTVIPADVAFGVRLKAVIKKAGLDIAKCARLWEVNENTLYKWCRGIVPMNAADYLALQAVVEQEDLDVFLPTKKASQPVNYKALYDEFYDDCMYRFEQLEKRIKKLEEALKTAKVYK